MRCAACARNLNAVGSAMKRCQHNVWINAILFSVPIIFCAPARPVGFRFCFGQVLVSGHVLHWSGAWLVHLKCTAVETLGMSRALKVQRCKGARGAAHTRGAALYRRSRCRAHSRCSAIQAREVPRALKVERCIGTRGAALYRHSRCRAHSRCSAIQARKVPRALKVQRCIGTRGAALYRRSRCRAHSRYSAV